MLHVNQIGKRAVAVVVLVFVFSMSITSTIFAQDIDKVFATNKYAMKNLKANISNENLGVRKGAIYLAGKYQVRETVPELISQLKNESENNVKILIALSLYYIGDETGIRAVESALENEANLRVKNMLSKIYTAFFSNSVVSELK